MPFATMKSLLPRRLQQVGLDRPVFAAQAVEVANQVLNEWFGEQTTHTLAQAVSIKHRNLCIASLDAGLRHALKMRESELVAIINQRLGKPCIEHVLVMV